MLSFWRNFRHWLHWKLSFWQLSVQPMTKILPKWLHLRFNVHVESSYFWYSWEIFQVPPVLWATQVPLGPWETRDQQDLLESPEPLVRQDLWDLREEPEVQVLRVSPEPQVCMPWWRHDVDILALYVENPKVTSGFSSQRASDVGLHWNFDVILTKFSSLACISSRVEIDVPVALTIGHGDDVNSD